MRHEQSFPNRPLSLEAWNHTIQLLRNSSVLKTLLSWETLQSTVLSLQAYTESPSLAKRQKITDYTFTHSRPVQQ